jgi:nitrous oxidase accessory protein
VLPWRGSATLAALICLIAFAGEAQPVTPQLVDSLPGGPTTLVVSPSGPFNSVGDAVQAAAPGSRIVVRAGTYNEPMVVVDRPLEIVGEGWPVLDAEGEHQILLVTADSVRVHGLVLRNVGVSYVEDRAAIKVKEASDCTIEGNRIENAFFGIYLAQASGCRVVNNEIVGIGSRETASGNGIHLWYSKDIQIRGNRIEGHRDGIYFEFVEDSEVSGNLSRHNVRYGLHFMFSHRCVYRDNTFEENNAGVAVMYTKQVTMEGNHFIDNWGGAAFGLLLKDITDSRIVGNTFRRNSVGIFAEGMNRVDVRRNAFSGNGWAVKIMANSLDNLFSLNEFTGNAFDVTTNSRQHFSTFAENYWDAYKGYDLDRDGFGDVPHRPVRLFSLIVERTEPGLVLLRSPFVELLDLAERAFPVLTPETLVDERPLMRPAGAGATTVQSMAGGPGAVRSNGWNRE